MKNRFNPLMIVETIAEEIAKKGSFQAGHKHHPGGCTAGSDCPDGGPGHLSRSNPNLASLWLPGDFPLFNPGECYHPGAYPRRDLHLGDGGGFQSVMGLGSRPGQGRRWAKLSGYLAGFSGQGRCREFQKGMSELCIGWKNMATSPFWCLAFIPNPLFDLAGMTAGILKMPVWKFLVFCVIGKDPQNDDVCLCR